MPEQWSEFSTGERVAFLRGSDLTQQGLAEAAELSVSTIQKVEQTSRASVGTLLRLARALNVDISVVLGQQGPRRSMTRSDRAALRAIESAVHSSALRLYPEDLTPGDLPSLQLAMREARRLHWAGRHVEIGSILPQLLLEATALTDAARGEERQAALRVLTDAYRQAALVGNHLGSRNLAYAAMTQAKAASVLTGDELLHAAQDVTLAWVLMRDAKLEEAVNLSLRSAARIEPSFSRRDPERGAVYGKLMIRAAVAASRQEDKDRAHDYMSEAHAAAARVEDEITPYEVTFGPTTASTEAVTVALGLGEVGKALKLIRTTEGVDRLKDVPRLRYQLSVALAQCEARQWDRSADTLAAIVDERPQWAKHQALVGVVNQRIAEGATAKARRISRAIGVPLVMR
ncbi:helix-turn-helix domain-containing protein [Streptomyces xiamenensis]|uniref:helix-turn-helix domain-containing protein n=1 Tax=Streptomyces xiamenensis TaxID=408015 RepID=UPI0036E023B2